MSADYTMADGPQNKWSSDEYWESPRHPQFSFKGFLHIHVYFGSAATFAQILWRKLWIAVDWNHASRVRAISWEYNEEAGKGPLHLYWGQESILGYRTRDPFCCFLNTNCWYVSTNFTFLWPTLLIRVHILLIRWPILLFLIAKMACIAQNVDSLFG